ncbi:hemerythrin domain-containing protein [Sphaerisporangium fuscum]|uniref:hemerythrin domain-containing protein n=1 Tax=Sphaerisporangium fuscum TaxID=2835868 RepID=UPI0027E2C185|nr:hemerythrin domain-containing protein [Sphaerisporangium fuscum]
MTTTHEKDVIDLLLAQHEQIKAMFADLTTARGDRKRELFDDLVRLLAVHESAEEQVVHPAARSNGGERVVEARLHEEDEAKHALSELYDLGVDHPEFDARCATLAKAVLEHATHEEQEEFPRLRQELSPEKLRRMAGAVRAAEAISPTRPHPGAGESAVANMLVGPPVAVFDKIRDAVRDWRHSNKD